MEVSLDLSQLLIGCFAISVWFLRLEGRVKGMERENALRDKRVDDLHGEHKALAEKVVVELGMVREALARIEERLKKDQ